MGNNQDISKGKTLLRKHLVGALYIIIIVNAFVTGRVNGKGLPNTASAVGSLVVLYQNTYLRSVLLTKALRPLQKKNCLFVCLLQSSGGVSGDAER